MIRRVRVLGALAIAAAVPLAAVTLPAQAADLPLVKLSSSNKVPVCATPGRLMGFLESRNGRIDPRFETIAADYMRIGNELKMRWDIAFFQMMLETGNLSFHGDVSASQNNFVGLGATGKRVPGESFPDVATGVKAHLQHLLLYAGEHLDNPVAERTRKVQEWGILADWQKSITGPVSYDQLTHQWAPTSKRYGHDIAAVAEAFYGSPCKGEDPKPEMLALGKPGMKVAKAKTAAPTQVATAEDTAPIASVEAPSDTPAEAPADSSTEQPTGKLSGADLARRAVDEARKSGSFVRSGLGASSLTAKADADAPTVGEPPQADATPEATSPASFKIINAATPPADAAAEAAPTADEPAASAPADSAPVEAKPKASSTKTAPQKKIQTAMLGASTASAIGSGTKAKVLAAPGGKSTCKVWTASYGGGHSVIIRARADAQDNYTVLDVNEGSEKREADAYIAAYAKGGVSVGQYTNPSQALDKAFELCPDG